MNALIACHESMFMNSRYRLVNGWTTQAWTKLGSSCDSNIDIRRRVQLQPVLQTSSGILVHFWLLQYLSGVFFLIFLSKQTNYCFLMHHPASVRALVYVLPPKHHLRAIQAPLTPFIA